MHGYSNGHYRNNGHDYSNIIIVKDLLTIVDMSIVNMTVVEKMNFGTDTRRPTVANVITATDKITKFTA